MAERVLIGRTIKVKYGISHEDGKLRFTICGLDELPKDPDSAPLIFEQILNMENVIRGYSSKEIIEYQKKEVFSLEACMCSYLIDYIKSNNSIEHLSKETLENIYNSDVIKQAFEPIGFEATMAIDKDDFFEKENQCMSIIHEAFKLNEETYQEPKEENEEEKISLNKPVEEDELDGDALDKLLEENNLNNVQDDEDDEAIEVAPTTVPHTSIRGIDINGK